ncbi:MAG TPA: hypothetical protein VF515_07310 [Candidatus Binatia bacterium]
MAKEATDTIFQHGQHEGLRAGQLAGSRFTSGDRLQSRQMEIVIFGEDLSCC